MSSAVSMIMRERAAQTDRIHILEEQINDLRNKLCVEQVKSWKEIASALALRHKD